MADLTQSGPVALTGATGFIGRHLVAALAGRGCHPVLLARSPAEDHPPFAAPRDRVRWVPADVTDPGSVRAALDRVKPAVLFHLAGVRDRGGAPAARRCEEVNVAGTLNVLDAAARSGVRRVVLVGSAEEYGDQPGPLHERLPPRPRTPYGISKAAATQFALALHESDRLPVVVVRPFSVYGPGQPAGMFVSQAVTAAVTNMPFRMTEGKQRRDLIHVADVVAALLAAAAAEAAEGRVLNAGSGVAHALCDVAARIWQLAGSTAPLLVGSIEARPGDLDDTWADIAAARRLLGWHPRIDLDTGLRQTVAWARGARGACTHEP